jgi:hypothetical protein
MDGKNHCSPGQWKITVRTLGNLRYDINQVEDAQTPNKIAPSEIYIRLYLLPAISTEYHKSSIYLPTPILQAIRMESLDMKVHALHF